MPQLLHFRGLEQAQVLSDGWTEGTTSDGDPWIEVNATIFYTGKHRGKMYTREDLQGAVDRFVPPLNDEDYGDALIQINHSDDPRDTIGSIRKVWMSGDNLDARLRFEGAAEVKAVKRKKWKRLSSGFWSMRVGSKLEYTIAEVSVTQNPELERASTYTHQDEEEEIPMPKPVDEDVAPAPEPKQLEQFTDDHPALKRMREHFAADMKARDDKHAADLKRQSEQHAESDKKRDLEFAKITKVLRFAELTRKIETFCSTGKSVPASSEKELALLETFDDAQLELYSAYKEASPAYVDFDVIGEQEAKAPPKSDKDPDEQTQEEVEAEAAALLEFSTQKKAQVA